MSHKPYLSNTCCQDGKRTPFCGVRFFCFHHSHRKEVNSLMMHAVQKPEIPKGQPLSGAA